jgi:hypothetical protein
VPQCQCQCQCQWQLSRLGPTRRRRAGTPSQTDSARARPGPGPPGALRLPVALTVAVAVSVPVAGAVALRVRLQPQAACEPQPDGVTAVLASLRLTRRFNVPLAVKKCCHSESSFKVQAQFKSTTSKIHPGRSGIKFKLVGKVVCITHTKPILQVGSSHYRNGHKAYSSSRI